MLEGFMNVYKPRGMTSHDVVNIVRRKFKIRRVGHAGTLDPMATGVLIILLGKGTKLFSKFSSFDKSYQATMDLGFTTDTADIEGKVLRRFPVEGITKERVEAIFENFRGELSQRPPMVSAVKVGGKKLYQLARKGIEVTRAARPIKIHSLVLLEFALPRVTFALDCSKGTYVRQLGEDIGLQLGCGACISQIERTKVGPFKIEDSIPLGDIDEHHIRRWQDSA